MMATVRVEVLAGVASSYSGSGVGKDGGGDLDMAQKKDNKLIAQEKCRNKSKNKQSRERNQENSAQTRDVLRRRWRTYAVKLL